MEDVARFASRILVMNQGKVFCYDTPERVFRRSEEIRELGLSVPQITRVFNALRSRGYRFDSEVYTVEYARDLILRYLKEKGGDGAC